MLASGWLGNGYLPNADLGGNSRNNYFPNKKITLNNFLSFAYLIHRPAMIHSEKINQISPSTENCRLGVLHLKRFWSAKIAKRLSDNQRSFSDEWETDKILLGVLGLGIEQTLQY